MVQFQFSCTAPSPPSEDDYTDVLAVTIGTPEQPGVNAAPAAVWFEVTDVTGCDAGAPLANGRDPKYHDITYVWDFGDSDNSTPFNTDDLNLLTAWKDRNKATGKRVAHVYTTPGTKTVTVTAYERSSLRKGSSTVEVTIGDPKTVFPTTRTIIWNPGGSVNIAPYGYTGANEVTGTWANVKTARAAVAAQTAQILLVPGVDLDNTVLADGESWANIRIGALDDTLTLPIIRGMNSENTALIRDNSSTKTEIVLFGIDFRGKWDSTTGFGPSCPILAASTNTAASQLTMHHRCKVDGFSLVGGGSGITGTAYLISNECTITNWQDYGMHGTRKSDGSFAAIACAVHQHVDALSGGDKDLNLYNQHGPCRMFTGGHSFISASSFFSRNGWSNGGVGVGVFTGYGVTADQPCLRFNTNGNANFRAHVERVFLEGGVGAEEQSGGQVPPDVPGNYVFDQFVQVLGSRNFTEEVFEIRHSGWSIRNGLCFVPNVPPGQGGRVPQWFYISNQDGNAANDAGIEIYNCTLIDGRDNTNANSITVQFAVNDNTENGGDDDTHLNVVIENNVFEQPNRSPAVIPDAPIQMGDLGLILRHKGIRYGFLHESGTIATDVPPGGSFTIPYSSIKTTLWNFNAVDDGAVTDQAYWLANAPAYPNAKHKLKVGDFLFYNENYLGSAMIEFEASQVRVYNRSASNTWTAGLAWALQLDRSSQLPGYEAQYSLSGITIPTGIPQAGSSAIDDATSGKRAVFDLAGNLRPSTGDERGARLTA